MEFRGLRMLSGDDVGGVCEFLEVGGQERRDYGVGETGCQVVSHQLLRRRRWRKQTSDDRLSLAENLRVSAHTLTHLRNNSEPKHVACIRKKHITGT